MHEEKVSQINRDIEFMKMYQKWRRGDEDLPQPEPKEIGECIDRMIDNMNDLVHGDRIDEMFDELLNDLKKEDLQTRSIFFRMKVLFLIVIEMIRTTIATWIMPHQAFWYIEKPMKEYLDSIEKRIDNIG